MSDNRLFRAFRPYHPAPSKKSLKYLVLNYFYFHPPFVYFVLFKEIC